MLGEKASAGYSVYKGLQQPLIFKSFKGKYIYWALGFMLGGFLFAVAFSVLVNYLAGFVSLFAVSFGGLLFTNSRQKRGLHDKTQATGTYIIPARLKRSRNPRI